MSMSATRLFLLLSVLTVSLGAQVTITEYCNDPWGTAGLDTNLDGAPATSSSQSDDEFVEIVNFGGSIVDIGGWTLADGFGTRHTFNGGTLLPPGAAIVVFGGGSVANFNSMGLSGVTADSGALGLNNGGDTITLTDNMGVVIDSQTYVSGGPGDGDGESVTRVPEGPGGAFTTHTTASPGVSHSAGFLNDGLTAYGAAIFPGTTYPGTNEDFVIETGINGSTSGGAGNDIKTAIGGDTLTIFLDTPGSTFVAQPIILGADVFITGFPPAGFLPGVHLGATYVALIDGLAPSPIGPPILTFSGLNVSYQLPMGLSMQSIMIQGGVLSGAAANGTYATTDAHEIRML